MVISTEAVQHLYLWFTYREQLLHSDPWLFDSTAVSSYMKQLRKSWVLPSAFEVYHLKICILPDYLHNRLYTLELYDNLPRCWRLICIQFPAEVGVIHLIIDGPA